MVKIYANAVQEEMREKLKGKGVELNKKQVKAIWDTLGEVYTENLEKMEEGDSIALPVVGTIKKVQRSARACRNPHTGEKMQVAAKMSVTLKASKGIKDKIN